MKLPDGYHELPLNDIQTAIDASENLVPSEARESFAEVAPAIGNLLAELRAQHTGYCGIGRHTAPDGTVVTSWLTISDLGYGPERNPRLVVAELVTDRSKPGTYVEPVELDGRTVLFTESTPTFLVGADSDEHDRLAATVHQIEAIVVADDGTRIAAAIFSTADVAYGAYFRTMMMSLATSMRFRVPGDTVSSLAL
ncbi:hypothetical protein [Nocardia lasii]|uniref:Uncharacterized protein n=1 Tax=Nocardia lasii TaxID=1616107 RepID=A0ABW1JZ37_9NOCA